MENQTPHRAMDDYGAEDMVIPELKLVQNVGGADAKAAGAAAGDFYCNVSGEVIPGTDGLDIVIVDIPKTRTYWGRTEIDDEPPICSSDDGLTNMGGESCAECPYQVRCDTPWLIPAAERRNLCLVNYNVLAIDARNNIPIMIRASGISTQAVKEIMTALRLNKQLRGEYHRALIHVASVSKNTASGEAFAMTLRMTGLIADEAQVEEFRGQSLQLLGTTIEALPLGERAALPEAEPVVAETVAEPVVAETVAEPVAETVAEPVVDPVAKAVAAHPIPTAKNPAPPATAAAKNPASTDAKTAGKEIPTTPIDTDF